MILYADLILMLNLLFDCLILLLTAFVLKVRLSNWRLVSGSLVGSLFVLLTIYQSNLLFHNPVIKLLLSILIVIVTFGYVRLRTFLKTLTTFYFITFLLGGILVGTHYFFAINNSFIALTATNKHNFGDPVSWLFVLVGFPLSWHFAKTKFTEMEVAKITYSELVDVTIIISNQDYEFKGLIDSGNNLYDPLSKEPVLIVSLYNHPQKFPKYFYNLANFNVEFEKLNSLLPVRLLSKVRLIPCRVIGNEDNLLVALKPDQLIISCNSNKFVPKRCLVSFTTQQLCAENKYNCIVHPEMMIKGAA